MNTIEKAVRYLNEPAGLAKTLDLHLRTGDLEVPCIFIGSKSVKYQHLEFEDYDLGDFSRDTGYAQKDFSLTWKEKTLSQDKGDSLRLEKMDDEESMANGIVTIANRYLERVQTPALDKYRLGVITSTPVANYINADLTASNIVSKLLEGRTKIINSKLNVNNTVLYISASADQILEEAAFSKGLISVGSWNGSLDTTVKMFKEAKKVVVPDSYLASGVKAILVCLDAVPAMKKYSECEYFSKIPGYGGRMAEVDIGLYHDCFVYDELARGICVFIDASTTTHTVTYAKGDSSATGTAPTQAATVAGTSFALASNAFTLTGKTFVGWTDGCNLYKAGDKYDMPNANVTLTAVWKNS